MNSGYVQKLIGEKKLKNSSSTKSLSENPQCREYQKDLCSATFQYAMKHLHETYPRVLQCGQTDPKIVIYFKSINIHIKQFLNSF